MLNGCICQKTSFWKLQTRQKNATGQERRVRNPASKAGMWPVIHHTVHGSVNVPPLVFRVAKGVLPWSYLFLFSVRFTGSWSPLCHNPFVSGILLCCDKMRWFKEWHQPKQCVYEPGKLPSTESDPHRPMLVAIVYSLHFSLLQAMVLNLSPIDARTCTWDPLWAKHVVSHCTATPRAQDESMCLGRQKAPASA